MLDRQIQCPSLHGLAADAIAETFSLLGHEAYRKSNNSVISWDADVFSHLPAELPKEVSQAIFNALRKKWDQRDVILVFDLKSLF